MVVLSKIISYSLFSIIYGKSSAFGGKDYNPERKTRMVIIRHIFIFSKCLYQPGVPLEFPNVCMAMLFFQENKNLNFKTQVTESGHHLTDMT